MPSSLMSLNTHLLSKHLFCKSKSKIPNPPWFLGVHSTSHFVSLYFFPMSLALPKESRSIVI